MNIYLVVEGKAERIVYPAWISIVNSSLSQVQIISDVVSNNYYLISGMGYPYYFDVIRDAISDINDLQIFDRLVVAVDSEDMSYAEKASEIKAFLDSHPCKVPIHTIIQHFCFETWALGNRKLVRRHAHDIRLREYINIHDVITLDPALLPELPQYDWNRAQFAYKYLKAAINERNCNIGYSKGSPRFVTHHKFFNEIQKRVQSSEHISSFKDFIAAFV